MRPVNSRTEAAPAPSSDDLLMLDVEFFGSDGRWRPRTVLFSAATDPQRAGTLRAALLGGLMRWHARLWATNYVKTHLCADLETKAFLADIRQKGSVDRKAFFSLVAERALGEVDPLGSEKRRLQTRTAGSLSTVPAFQNLHTVIRDHLARFPWEKRDESAFSSLTPLHAANLAKVIGTLRSCDENDALVSGIRAFAAAFFEWTGSLDDVYGKHHKRARIYEPLKQAIEAYIPTQQECLTPPLPGIGSSDEKAAQCDAEEASAPEVQIPEVAAHDALFYCYQRFADHELNPPAPVAEALESGFLEYCRIGKSSLPHLDTDRLRREILEMDVQKWQGLLRLLTPSQVQELNHQREQLQTDLAALELAGSRRSVAAGPNPAAIADIYEGEAELDQRTVSSVDWDKLGASLHLSLSDMRRLGDWLDSLEPGELAPELVPTLSSLLAAAKREQAWGASFFKDEDARRDHRDWLHNQVIGTAAELLARQPAVDTEPDSAVEDDDSEASTAAMMDEARQQLKIVKAMLDGKSGSPPPRPEH